MSVVVVVDEVGLNDLQYFLLNSVLDHYIESSDFALGAFFGFGFGGVSQFVQQFAYFFVLFNKNIQLFSFVIVEVVEVFFNFLQELRHWLDFVVYGQPDEIHSLFLLLLETDSLQNGGGYFEHDQKDDHAGCKRHHLYFDVLVDLNAELLVVVFVAVDVAVVEAVLPLHDEEGLVEEDLHYLRDIEGHRYRDHDVPLETFGVSPVPLLEHHPQVLNQELLHKHLVQEVERPVLLLLEVRTPVGRNNHQHQEPRLVGVVEDEFDPLLGAVEVVQD
mmetsp:Transcript_27159/g.59734  ORF Transcript_27159/g.59734 Transcript_27159/m.59734 type:complete len:274 (-) Transcript_27159:1084-1905(-)|eukprot:CAMPEP_0116945486 /NCGR_PEP_ID=MMETSP0467-20121206/36395_1 /TAXON_ID=283647 /ORGANISM="Mesodinium pulex, Strain SPMC105" /LENGTH=273 /DNA_ID=CAMNT_0004629035 /DNA_START=351 /DNA_END=1172 /DNA_ORIENTATION=+